MRVEIEKIGNAIVSKRTYINNDEIVMMERFSIDGKRTQIVTVDNVNCTYIGLQAFFHKDGTIDHAQFFDDFKEVATDEEAIRLAGIEL